MAKMSNKRAPTIINLPITEICDSRCRMCNVWKNGKDDELTAEAVDRIFSDKFFGKVSQVGLSGGEPLLNKELVAICNTLIARLPKLKAISMTSHGFHTALHGELLPQIKEACDRSGVRFSLNLSLDGYGSMHDAVRRFKDAFLKVTATARLAHGFGIPVRFQCTISSVNAYGIVHVREFARLEGFDIDFRVASTIPRLSNDNLREVINLDAKARSFVADFVDSPATIFATASLGRRLYYKELSRILRTGGKRAAPCHFQNDALYVSPDGKIYSCSRFDTHFDIPPGESVGRAMSAPGNLALREKMICEVCPGCHHDQSGRWSLWRYFTVTRQGYNALNKLRKLSRISAIVANSLGPIRKGRRTNLREGLKSALLIGCYGGEHVGDAAILGGVILRLRDRHGITSFSVASLRPDRTSCWAANLHIEGVEIRVLDTGDALEALAGHDALVLAGGPVMEIPTLLSWHLSLVTAAQRHHKPFIVEGIGLGPFNTWICRNMARRIVRAADEICVRSERDTRLASAWNDAVTHGRDPAFDYLEYVKASAVARPDRTKPLWDTNKRLCVVNLRPFWNKYAKGKTGSANFARVMEVLARFMARHAEQTRFVFMPMNADQFGFSDLECAYRLEAIIKQQYPSVDYRIWETEPDIDGCLALLGKASLSICMRFHACIFSIAAGIPTVGLDYSSETNGKVGSLFKDAGLEKNVAAIDKIDEAWLEQAAGGAL
jgi:MoaA/NifB/PqqE/SkfB family radical SAM enzyme/polysaccharide pyruvyl transferase WcaK-like protein